MPTVEAHVRTDRPSRYLVQLCRHLHQMSRMRHLPKTRYGGAQTPPAVQDVEFSETSGLVRFAVGRLTLRATADTLTLRVDADDEDALRRLQSGIAGRLERIGRRDQLSVTWQPSEEGTDTAHTPQPDNGRHPRGRFTATVLVAVVVLVVAVHLGLGGAALAASSWTGWATNIVLAVIVLKLIAVAAHIVLGRFAIRRGKIVHARWKLRRSEAVHDPTAGPFGEQERS
jgi:hypothetical protein